MSNKSKTFFDGFGFIPSLRLKIKKAILEIANGSQEACVAEGGSVVQTIREESNTTSFSDVDRRVPFPHNKPLFVTDHINGVELKQAFLDGGPSINIVPLEMLKKLGILELQNYKILSGYCWLWWREETLLGLHHSGPHGGTYSCNN